jgi:phage shock protein A
MPIVHRLTRLFRADVHAVLDRIEEPELLLAQSIREMEAALADEQQRLQALAAQGEAQQRRRSEIAATLAGIGEQLDLCFEAGNQDLARLLLRRRLEGERLVARLERDGARLTTEAARLQRGIEERRQALEALRRQAAQHLQRDDATSAAAAPAWSAEDLAVSDADVELALLREQRRRA